MKLIRRVLRNNRIALLFGAMVGVIGTRFMEDGNLLVTSVLVILTTTISLCISLLLKRLFRR